MRLTALLAAADSVRRTLLLAKPSLPHGPRRGTNGQVTPPIEVGHLSVRRIIPGAVAEKRTVVASRQTSCKPNPVINLTKRAFRNREAFGSCRAPCSLSLTFPGMGSFMILTTEEMGEIPNVKAADIDRILPTDSFGKFAVLSASDTTFLQAGNDWQPTPECEAFLKNTRSDPWVLEYRDGESGKQYRAHGQLTLDQVRVAFLSYLAGSKDWQNAHAWNELAL